MAERGPTTGEDATNSRLQELGAANRVLRARLAIEERLAADAGAGLAACVRACHELTGRPAVAFDRDGRLVCQVPVGPSLPPLETLIAGLPEGSAQPAGALLISGGLSRRVLLAPVERGGEHLGWLAVEERGGAFDAFTAIAVERTAHRLAGEYLIQRRIVRVASDARSALARQLARGTRCPEDLRASGDYLGVDVDARRILVVVLDPEHDEAPATLESTDLALAEHIGRTLSAEVLHTRGTEGVLMMVEVPPEATDAGALTELKAALRSGLAERFLPGAVAGISRASSPEGFATAYREAREVAHCIQRFRTGSTALALAVDDLGPARLFLANTTAPALRSYVSDVLGALLGDAPGMTQLLVTLQVWLEAGRSIRATAARLGLHENTIRLRLARIQKCTGLDVTDPNDQLALQTGILLLRLQGHPDLPPLDASIHAGEGRITA